MHRSQKVVTTWKARSLLHAAHRSCIYETALLQTRNAVAPFHEPVSSIRNYITTTNEESFMNISSVSYMEEMFNLWLDDRTKVHASWDSYFKRVLKGALPGQAYQSPPTIRPPTLEKNLLPANVKGESPKPAAENSNLKSQPQVQPQKEITSPAPPMALDKNMLQNQLLLMSIIRGYQTRGHLIAKLDPLGLSYSFSGPKRPMDEIILPPKTIIHDRILELTQSDLDKVFTLPHNTYVGGNQGALPLKEIFTRLENAYCQHIGVECGHIDSIPILRWVRQKFEPPDVMKISKEVRRLALERLLKSDTLEDFMDKKWPTQPRFSLEGGDVLIPALHQIVDKVATMGAESIIIGMPHRGRLNVIANVCERPLQLVFAEFFPLELEEELPGDVKYHLGNNTKLFNKAANKEIDMVMVNNPSHLEAVNPVMEGKARAEQSYRNDKDGKKVVPIIIHGDAGMCGEGVVYETFLLSTLPCYTTKGTIHLVCNNQIGYTTSPHEGRSSTYCTDVAKTLGIPIFHVNGDQPDEVIYCCNVAAEFRNEFHKDVVVDIIGYRKRGHSETDDPVPTSPVLYAAIKKLPSTFQLYSKKLLDEKVVTEAELKELVDNYQRICEQEFQKAEKMKVKTLKTWSDTSWEEFFKNRDPLKADPTGVKEDILMHIGERISTPPPEDKIVLHRTITRLLKARSDMLKNKILNWAMAEAMAYGSLLKEGNPVRMTGEDCERGTFSQRQHVYHHQKYETVKYSPLTDLFPGQAEYKICNSPLSEYAVMGFELGYSQTIPNVLVVWEAQYGDFANNAQCIIDSFIASGEAKWLRQTGIVLMLPHGMEGAGPEHSSGRIERFLQLSSDDPDILPDLKDKDIAMKQLRETNWIIANLTTPANLFHILRRQIALPFRKPLVIFTPKSLLRHPEAISPISDLTEGTELKRVIPEDGPASKDPNNVAKLILCSGKVYYDIKDERSARKLDEKIAITRIEQLCPFPYDLVSAEVRKYPKAEICWGQEEHKNSGAWSYVFQRIDSAAGDQRQAVTYAGRGCSASTASAVKPAFAREKKQLIDECLQPRQKDVTTKGTKQHGNTTPKVASPISNPAASPNKFSNKRNNTLSDDFKKPSNQKSDIKSDPKISYHNPYLKLTSSPKKIYPNICSFKPMMNMTECKKSFKTPDLIFGSTRTMNSKLATDIDLNVSNNSAQEETKSVTNMNKSQHGGASDWIFGAVERSSINCQTDSSLRPIVTINQHELESTPNENSDPLGSSAKQMKKHVINIPEPRILRQTPECICPVLIHKQEQSKREDYSKTTALEVEKSASSTPERTTLKRDTFVIIKPDIPSTKSDSPDSLEKLKINSTIKVHESRNQQKPRESMLQSIKKSSSTRETGVTKSVSTDKYKPKETPTETITPDNLKSTPCTNLEPSEDQRRERVIAIQHNAFEVVQNKAINPNIPIYTRNESSPLPGHSTKQRNEPVINIPEPKPQRRSPEFIFDVTKTNQWSYSKSTHKEIDRSVSSKMSFENESNAKSDPNVTIKSVTSTLTENVYSDLINNHATQMIKPAINIREPKLKQGKPESVLGIVVEELKSSIREAVKPKSYQMLYQTECDIKNCTVQNVKENKSDAETKLPMHITHERMLEDIIKGKQILSENETPTTESSTHKPEQSSLFRKSSGKENVTANSSDKPAATFGQLDDKNYETKDDFSSFGTNPDLNHKNATFQVIPNTKDTLKIAENLTLNYERKSDEQKIVTEIDLDNSKREHKRRDVPYIRRTITAGCILNKTNERTENENVKLKDETSMEQDTKCVLKMNKKDSYTSFKGSYSNREIGIKAIASMSEETIISKSGPKRSLEEKRDMLGQLEKIPETNTEAPKLERKLSVIGENTKLAVQANNFNKSQEISLYGKEHSEKDRIYTQEHKPIHPHSEPKPAHYKVKIGQVLDDAEKNMLLREPKQCRESPSSSSLKGGCRNVQFSQESAITTSNLTPNAVKTLRPHSAGATYSSREKCIIQNVAIVQQKKHKPILLNTDSKPPSTKSELEKASQPDRKPKRPTSALDDTSKIMLPFKDITKSITKPPRPTSAPVCQSRIRRRILPPGTRSELASVETLATVTESNVCSVSMHKSKLTISTKQLLESSSVSEISSNSDNKNKAIKRPPFPNTREIERGNSIMTKCNSSFNRIKESGRSPSNQNPISSGMKQIPSNSSQLKETLSSTNTLEKPCEVLPANKSQSVSNVKQVKNTCTPSYTTINRVPKLRPEQEIASHSNKKISLQKSLVKLQPPSSKALIETPHFRESSTNLKVIPRKTLSSKEHLKEMYFSTENVPQISSNNVEKQNYLKSKTSNFVSEQAVSKNRSPIELLSNIDSVGNASKISTSTDKESLDKVLTSSSNTNVKHTPKSYLTHIKESPNSALNGMSSTKSQCVNLKKHTSRDIYDSKQISKASDSKINETTPKCLDSKLYSTKGALRESSNSSLKKLQSTCQYSLSELLEDELSTRVRNSINLALNSIPTRPVTAPTICSTSVYPSNKNTSLVKISEVRTEQLHVIETSNDFKKNNSRSPSHEISTSNKIMIGTEAITLNTPTTMDKTKVSEADPSPITHAVKEKEFLENGQKMDEHSAEGSLSHLKSTLSQKYSTDDNTVMKAISKKVLKPKVADILNFKKSSETYFDTKSKMKATDTSATKSELLRTNESTKNQTISKVQSSFASATESTNNLAILDATTSEASSVPVQNFLCVSNIGLMSDVNTTEHIEKNQEATGKYSKLDKQITGKKLHISNSKSSRENSTNPTVNMDRIKDHVPCILNKNQSTKTNTDATPDLGGRPESSDTNQKLHVTTSHLMHHTEEQDPGEFKFALSTRNSTSNEIKTESEKIQGPNLIFSAPIEYAVEAKLNDSAPKVNNTYDKIEENTVTVMNLDSKASNTYQHKTNISTASDVKKQKLCKESPAKQKDKHVSKPTVLTNTDTIKHNLADNMAAKNMEPIVTHIVKQGRESKRLKNSTSDMNFSNSIMHRNTDNVTKVSNIYQNNTVAEINTVNVSEVEERTLLKENIISEEQKQKNKLVDSTYIRTKEHNSSGVETIKIMDPIVTYATKQNRQSRSQNNDTYKRFAEASVDRNIIQINERRDHLSSNIKSRSQINLRRDETLNKDNFKKEVLSTKNLYTLSDGGMHIEIDTNKANMSLYQGKSNQNHKPVLSETGSTGNIGKSDMGHMKALNEKTALISIPQTVSEIKDDAISITRTGSRVNRALKKVRPNDGGNDAIKTLDQKNVRSTSIILRSASETRDMKTNVDNRSDLQLICQVPKQTIAQDSNRVSSETISNDRNDKDNFADIKTNALSETSNLIIPKNMFKRNSSNVYERNNKMDKVENDLDNSSVFHGPAKHNGLKTAELESQLLNSNSKDNRIKPDTQRTLLGQKSADMSNSIIVPETVNDFMHKTNSSRISLTKNQVLHKTSQVPMLRSPNKTSEIPYPNMKDGDTEIEAVTTKIMKWRCASVTTPTEVSTTHNHVVHNESGNDVEDLRRIQNLNENHQALIEQENWKQKSHYYTPSPLLAKVPDDTVKTDISYKEDLKPDTARNCNLNTLCKNESKHDNSSTPNEDKIKRNVIEHEALENDMKNNISVNIHTMTVTKKINTAWSSLTPGTSAALDETKADPITKPILSQQQAIIKYFKSKAQENIAPKHSVLTSNADLSKTSDGITKLNRTDSIIPITPEHKNTKHSKNTYFYNTRKEASDMVNESINLAETKITENKPIFQHKEENMYSKAISDKKQYQCVKNIRKNIADIPTVSQENINFNTMKNKNKDDTQVSDTSNFKSSFKIKPETAFSHSISPEEKTSSKSEHLKTNYSDSSINKIITSDHKSFSERSKTTQESEIVNTKKGTANTDTSYETQSNENVIRKYADSGSIKCDHSLLSNRIATLAETHPSPAHIRDDVTQKKSLLCVSKKEVSKSNPKLTNEEKPIAFTLVKRSENVSIKQPSFNLKRPDSSIATNLTCGKITKNQDNENPSVTEFSDIICHKPPASSDTFVHINTKHKKCVIRMTTTEGKLRQYNSSGATIERSESKPGTRTLVKAVSKSHHIIPVTAKGNTTTKSTTSLVYCKSYSKTSLIIGEKSDLSLNPILALLTKSNFSTAILQHLKPEQLKLLIENKVDSKYGSETVNKTASEIEKNSKSSAALLKKQNVPLNVNQISSTVVSRRKSTKSFHIKPPDLKSPHLNEKINVQMESRDLKHNDNHNSRYLSSGEVNSTDLVKKTNNISKLLQTNSSVNTTFTQRQSSPTKKCDFSSKPKPSDSVTLNSVHSKRPISTGVTTSLWNYSRDSTYDKTNEEDCSNEEIMDDTIQESSQTLALPPGEIITEHVTQTNVTKPPSKVNDNFRIAPIKNKHSITASPSREITAGQATQANSTKSSSQFKHNCRIAPTQNIHFTTVSPFANKINIPPNHNTSGVKVIKFSAYSDNKYSEKVGNKNEKLPDLPYNPYKKRMAPPEADLIAER